LVKIVLHIFFIDELCKSALHRYHCKLELRTGDNLDDNLADCLPVGRQASATTVTSQ